MSDGFDDFPDLGSLDEGRLRELIRSLEAEALQVSFARRVLHAKIDILRAELVNRLRKKHESGEDVMRFDDREPPGPDGGVRQPRPVPPRGPGSLKEGAAVGPRSGAESCES